MLERLLSLDEVGDHLRCSKRQVEKLVARSEIASLKVGRSRVIRESTLERYIESVERLATEEVSRCCP
jgi:excisionase family DNA binding protein